MKYALDVSIAGTYSNPRTLADLAAEAEDAGWDGFFVWDAIFFSADRDMPMTDPWIALAAIAMKTERIRIGAMITPLARRRPWQVARETVALDHLSKGRLIIGAGLGYQATDFETFGENTDPMIRAEKLDEGLEILTGLWSGEPLRFRGKHYQVNNARFHPKPMQTPRIPVWVTGFWPNRRPFRRAAHWDGVLPGRVNEEPLTSQDLKAVIAYIQAHRAIAVPFQVAVYGHTPSDPEKAAEIIKPFIEAGATWWREGIEDSRGSLEEMRLRIRSGPAKVE